VIIVSLLAFIGIFTISIKEDKLKKILVYFISFAAGALLGDVFIHLMPEITGDGFSLQISLSILAGVLIFFILEKVIHGQDYHHDCHEHDHKKSKKKEKRIEPVAYMSLIASTIHGILDGIVIAAAFLVDIHVGVATAIAVGLHEIPHKLGSYSILLHGGFARKKALILNFVAASFALIGAILTLIIGNDLDVIRKTILPIAAGGLIYIASSDLIPELHKESSGFRSSALQLIYFILGICVMLLLLTLE
jgi:zinc and cadmium transporter